MYDLAYTPPLPYINPTTGRNPQGGRSFFVRASSISGHVTASDDNEGTDPQYPLATVQAALDKCVASMGDYIFVLYFSAIDSAPLTIPVRTIHLVACSDGAQDNRNDLYSGGSADAINITATGRDFELAGFNVGCGSTSYNAIEAESGETMSRGHIHHCSFGYNYSAKNGIYVPSVNASTISHCQFGSLCNEYGFYGYDMTEVTIAHCVFSNCGTKCLYIGTGHYNKIFSNFFFEDEASISAKGWAIHIAAGTYNMIMGNMAGSTGEAATYTAFIDATGAVGAMTNGWAGNISGSAFDEPDQS